MSRAKSSRKGKAKIRGTAVIYCRCAARKKNPMCDPCEKATNPICLVLFALVLCKHVRNALVLVSCALSLRRFVCVGGGEGDSLVGWNS